MSESQIQAIIKEVSTQNIQQNLNKLSSFHTRHSKSPLLNDTSEWIMKELKRLGYPDTYFHIFNATIDNEEFELRNVICKKKGATDKLIIICAHYDCIMNNKGDSESRAPGANDNASGLSAIIEIARILA